MYEPTGAPTEDEHIAGEWITPQSLLHQQCQTLHALAHIGVTGRDPDPYACRNRDHRRSRTSSTRANAVASTPASTMTRRPFPTIITMHPIAGTAGTVGAAGGSGTTVAGTKPVRCASTPFVAGQNNLCHCINREREIPYRRAVDEIARGVCKLSSTIRSFSSSDQRRRRPVSTTSSRSIRALYLLTSIRTVTHQSTDPNKAAATGGKRRTGLRAICSVYRALSNLAPHGRKPHRTVATT